MIGVLGDLHLGRVLYGYDLTDDIRRTMVAFHAWCVRRGVDRAVQLGDVFDRPTPLEHHRKIFGQWCNMFEKAGIPLVVMAGNHDCMGGGNAPTALEAFKTSQWQHVQIVDRPTAIDGMLMLPWPSAVLYPERDDWLEDVYDAQADAAGWAFAHLNVYGATLGDQEMIYRGSEYDIPDDVLSDSDIVGVVCGHVHKPQTLGSVRVVGSAVRLRFDEAKQVRVFADVGRGRVRYYKHNHARRLRQLGVDVSGWAHGGTTPSTGEVIEDLSRSMVRDRIVKVIPFVDESSAVDWAEVEASLYKRGATHVYVAPATTLRREIKSKQKIDALDADGHARAFIVGRIADKAERRLTYHLFKTLRKRVEDGLL